MTKLAERATVRKANALTLLAQPPSQLYDFIYIAPPQYQGLWLDALTALDKNPGWLQADGQAIVQIDPTENAPYELRHFALDDERRYGNTTLLFFNVKSLHGEEQDRG
ncbi:hypothetical protein B7486_77430 [cyanobacterium TDX16]|nr:hypothetical protein B7486_77430 [cyanobacterium TDX16]